MFYLNGHSSTSTSSVAQIIQNKPQSLHAVRVERSFQLFHCKLQTAVLSLLKGIANHLLVAKAYAIEVQEEEDEKGVASIVGHKLCNEACRRTLKERGEGEGEGEGERRDSTRGDGGLFNYSVVRATNRRLHFELRHHLDNLNALSTVYLCGYHHQALRPGQFNPIKVSLNFTK